MSRSRFLLAALATGLLGGAAAGCNVIVGVGDYAAGSAGDASIEGGTGEGGGNPPGDDGALPDGQSGGEGAAPGDGGGSDAPADALADGPADGASDAMHEGGGGDGGMCAPDNSVGCPSGDGEGFTCSGTHSPEDANPSWNCGSPYSTTATTSSYCCYTCNTDTTVTGCALHLTGYSCAGTDSPSLDGLISSCTPATNNGASAHGFCCTDVQPISCSTNYDCYAYSYGVCDATKHCAPATGAVGDPCSTGTDCSSSLSCNGDWCQTTSCTTNASCGTATSAIANECQSAGSSGNVCFPGCTSNNDCYIYSNPNAFCVPGDPSVAGGVCSASGGGIGDPCFSSTECTGSLFCNDFGACSQACTGTSDTSCGTNNNAKTNRCVYDSYDAQYECMPGCTANSDCVEYSFSSPAETCTTVTGGKVCQ